MTRIRRRSTRKMWNEMKNSNKNDREVEEKQEK